METYPLLESQLGIVMEWMKDPSVTQYNLPCCLTVPKKLSPDRLVRAVLAMVEQRKVLRTRFVMVDGEVRQYSDPDMKIPVKRSRMSDAEAKAYLEHGFVRPYDLFSGEPLFRAEMIEAESSNFLVMEIHHSIGDGVTLAPNFSMIDFPKAYYGIPLKPIDYGMYDYAIDEQKTFGTELYERAKKHYLEKFEGVDFVTLAENTDTNLGEMIRESAFISQQQVDTWCAEHGTKSNLLFMAAFSLVLARFTRSEEVAYYTVIHGRMDKRLRYAYGMFVKSIPILAKVDGEQDSLAFINGFRAQMMDAIRYGAYPFNHFCRDLHQSPKVSFGFQGVSMQEYTELDGEHCPAVQLPKGKIDDDMSCVIYLREGNYDIRMESSAALNTSHTLRCVANAVKACVEGMMAAPEAAMKSLEVLTPEEKAQVLALSQGEPLSYDARETFPSLFMQRAQETPDAPAVVDACGTYSYATLNRLSGALALKLRDLGVGSAAIHSPFVSIMLGYQKEFLVAAIGVEKAGGAYVPLDYDYPNERLLYMLADSESQVLITTRAIFAEKTAEGDEFTAKNILFIEDCIAEACPAAAETVNFATPEGLAYMIYTSGSTGKPKGVMISHAAKTNFVHFIAKAWKHTAQSRICCHSSFSFDASIEDLYPVLTVGGTLYTVPQEARKDMELLHRFIVENHITGGCYTTQLGIMLLQQYPDLPVDYLVVGGEKMAANPACHTRLLNTYGPTEFTVDATYYETIPGKEYKNIPIGRPLANLAAYVVDPHGHLVPQGMAGELCMAGVQMASGYWKREELTAEKFTPCAFAGGRMYHTGDLVRYNAEGQLEYLGRIDNQVKLRGFRIELGEIETLIAGYPGIRMESVQVKEVAGVQHLCAYYTADRSIDPEELRAYLSGQLTEYMVPTAYMQLEEMPLTPNGKVNTKVLPMPEIRAEEIVAPETETERRLFEITAELLKHDQFGVTTNLISAGLTSLTAMRLAAMIQKRMEVVLPTKYILKSPYVRKLAEIIASDQALAQEDQIYDKRKFYPITENQRGVYVDWEMNREALQYNMPEVIRFGDTDPEALCEAVRVAVNAHPSLKGCLCLQDEDVMQVRDDDAEVIVHKYRVETEPDAAYFQQFVQPFDVFQAPLYRFNVVQSPTTTYLFTDIHHLFYDGVSSYIFLESVRRALRGEAVTAETYTSFDRALYEQEWMASEEFKEAETFFRNLTGTAELATYPRSATPDTVEPDSAHVNVSLKGSQIDAFCQQNGCTQNSFFLTAFAQTLHRLTREENLLFTSINNGRSTTATQGITGMFVKTLPVVSSTSLDPKVKTSFTEAVATMQQQFMDTLARDLYPYAKVVEYVQFHPEIMMIYQGGMDLLPEDGLDDSLLLKLNTVKMPIVTMVVPDGKGNYLIDIEYDTHLYNRADMVQLANVFKNVAKQAPAFATNLADIQLVSPTEEQELIELSKGTEIEYNRDETYLDLFLRHVANQPDQPALVDRKATLTYADLHREACRTAHFLQAKGIGRGDVVAIMLPRVNEFFVSVLGVQLAGAAYVPVDMDYAEDRRHYMIEDSMAKVVIDTELLAEIAQTEEVSPINLARPEDVAYMIYTSGSTGKPKGVPVSHLAIRTCAAWNIATFELKPGKQNLHHPSFSFDASTFDLFYPLAAGATVHVLDEVLRKDMDLMAQYVKEHHITGMTMSTALGMALLNQFDLPIEYIMLGGEKFMPVKKSKVRLYNGYGPTEFTVCSSFHLIDQDKDVNIPIGRAVPNSYSVICDYAGNLMPRGIPGELCLIGDQIANGYWNRPELTAEKFVDCRFLPGKKMYRTGDLAVWNADGELDFLGRIDNQVKLRGFRIELGEIENQASLFEGMLAVVAEVKTKGNNQHLCLYYTAEKAIDVEALQAHLATILTDYMMPDAYIQLEEMPMTPNGKVNRRLLPEPVFKSDVEYVEPEGPVEQAIAEKIGLVLGLEAPVGALDSFFALGGDSIKSIRLVSLLRQEGIHLKVADVMKAKTVRAIARISQLQANAESIDQEPWEGEVPPTAIQRFFFDLGLPNAAHFNQSMLLRCTRPIPTETLRRALNVLVNHHDLLRAVVKDEALFVPNVSGEAVLEEVTCTEADWQHELNDAAEEAQASLDLSQGLFKTLLLHTKEEDYILFVAHHLVVDGVSWRILLEDLNTLFAQAKADEAMKLPLKTHSYKAYAEALRTYRDGWVLSTEIPYWDQVQAAVNALPTSNGKDYTRSFASIHAKVDAPTTLAFRQADHARFGTDSNDLLLTAVGRSYQQVTGQTSVSVQMEGHGREKMDGDLLIDRTVGWFTSVYPVVLTDLGQDITHDLCSVKETLHRVPNKGLGYNVLRFIASQRGSEGNKRYNVPQLSYDADRIALIGFNYLGEMDEKRPNDALFVLENQLRHGEDIDPKNRFGTAIALNCAIEGSQLHVDLDYDQAVFTEAQAEAFVTGIQVSLQQILQQIREKQTTEITATDLGENEWTNEEFRQIYQHFMEKGTPIRRIYPLNPMQEGMLLKYLMEPDSLAYRLVSRITLQVLPTEAQLRYALDQVGARREVLRTSIIHKGVSHYRQAILDRPLGLEMRDVTGEADPNAAIAAMHRQEQERGFDLQEDPLFRIICVKTSEKSCEIITCVHHAVVDGWCISLYTGDFLYYLNEALEGKTSPFDRSQDGLYEAYIREYQTKDMAAGLEYWSQLLNGYESKAVVPSAGEVPVEEQAEDDVVTFRISGKALKRLNKVCADAQVTINTAVELAWGVLLQSFNRTEDAVFVKVVSGRNNTSVAVESLVGLFINSIPVRVRTAKGMTVSEALHAVQVQAAESNAMDFCPLADIQQQTDLGSELFQSILAFENYAVAENREADALQTKLGLRRSYAKEESFNEISVVAEGGEQSDLILTLTFDKHLYRRFEIERVMKAFETLLLGIAAHPEAEVQSLALVDGDAATELRAIASGDEMPLAPGMTFVSEFQRQAAETPEYIAVVDKDSSITYAELERKSNILAHQFQALGLHADQFVGIMLDRQKEFHVAVLGIQKLGAAYLPMDYEYPTERLQYMFEDSEAEILVTTHQILAEKQAEGHFDPKHIVFIEDVDFTAGDETPINLATPENRAYMIYTSGSTGKPKGVIIQQQAKINFVKFLAHLLEEKPLEHICCYASFSFDASIKDLYPPLTVGATLYLVPTAIRKDMNELTKWLFANNINGGNYTTKIGELLMANFKIPARYVMVGGEKLESFPPMNRGHLRLLNSYGPTETTVDVTTHWVDPYKEYANIPIGRPVANTTAYIVDAQDRLTPRGIPGELCISGVQLAEGYFNRPDLTNKMFAPCPFEPAGNRMYHTGDLCRWNEDGEIEYIGRIDNQVKLRGYRIELGEIESRIAKYEGVALACVLVKELNGVQNLCAYFTAKEPIDIEALKAYLGETLTEYMVPTVYMQLEKMPMTQNGKINRRALPMPTLTASAEEQVAPETAEEQQLWDIITKMLKTKEIGVTSNLVSVGLSSIAAMRLSALLMKNGLSLSAKEILAHPTIRELAKKVTTAAPDAVLKPYEMREWYPMNESQRGMYVDWMMHPDALQYNIPSMFKFKGLDLDQLKRAIDRVLEAHPYLNVRLGMRDGEIVQLRNDHLPIQLSVEALDFEPDNQFFQQRIRPFDLMNEPLYRFNIYTYQDTIYLLMDIHHIIGDGSSNYVLAQELQRAYNGEALEKEEYTAYDRALDEVKLMESERGKKAEAYFDQLVGGVEATVYPHSDVTPSKVVYGLHTIDIEPEQIDAFCRRHSLAPSGFFLTVFHQVLHRVTRDEQTLVYFISNGRSELKLDNFFGVLVKTLPTVVSRYQGDMASLVKEMNDQMQETISNDFYPFTKMVERHGLKAEILYNYFVDLQTNITLGEHTDEGLALDWDTAKTPLSITVVRGEEGQYQSLLEYDATLYTEADMIQLNEAFKAFAESCVLPTCKDLAAVPMASAEKEAELIRRSQGEPMAYDAKETFPSIFMKRALETPDAPAVVDENGTFSYAELNHLSGALAMKLRALGVGSQQVHSPFVSIMLGYQKEFLVAAIGVEKAGGAYVPLDYDYPNERLLYMLEDSESQVLITTHAIFNEKNAEGDSFTAKNIVFIEDFIADTATMSPEADTVNFATPKGLAYMIYTSGSTGKPKGVMISHAAKTNFVHFIAKAWKHTAQSRICCHSSFSFDASIEDLYPVLTVGGTLYTVPQEARKDMGLLHQFILDNGITGGCYTTQLGIMLLQQYPDLPVDYLVVGGEKMAANPACQTRLINTYGPTEFTVDATFYETVPGKEYKNIPIGRPLYNLAAYVVDPQGHLLPQGMPGELCMAGVQMASGYWKREDLTAEKFTSCAFTEGKIYHTGDLVKYNADGQIEYLGRIDNQVKLRGFRIELGEIETLIAQYPGIRMESVQVKEVGGVQHLCAYYSADVAIDQEALRAFLAEQLTDYMVPTAYMQLDQMPLTPNGKVNTKALPLPEIKAEEIVLPETEMEQKLFDIAVELLKHDQFGVTTNLISMGLTSLSAIRLTAIIQDKLEVMVPVADLLANPTLRQIAALIDSGKVKSTKKADIFTKRAPKPAEDGDEGAAKKGNPLLAKKGNPLTAKKGNPLLAKKGNPLAAKKNPFAPKSGETNPENNDNK